MAIQLGKLWLPIPVPCSQRSMDVQAGDMPLARVSLIAVMTRLAASRSIAFERSATLPAPAMPNHSCDVQATEEAPRR